MNTKIVNYRGTAYLYYAAYQEKFRRSTNIGITDEKYFVNGEFVKGEPDYKKKNYDIQVIKKKVDDLILKYEYENGKAPTIAWLKEALAEKPANEEGDEKKLNILNLFKQFKGSLNVRSTTLKTYNTLEASLEKFAAEKTVDKIDVSFIRRFEKFLGEEKLANSTVYRRVKALKTFLRWLRTEDKYDVNLKVIDYKITTQNKMQRDVVIFEIEELKKLQNIKFKNDEKGKRFERIRDIMVLLCQTGLRWSDFIRLSPHHIKNGVIDIVAQKTNEQCIIPLCDKSEEILEKYNFNWGIAEQNFNIAVKDMLDYCGMCSYEFKTETYNQNTLTEKPIRKSRLISSKTGRRTFISILVKKNVPINLIMRATGHKKLEQIMTYLEIYGSKDNSFINVFDKL